MQASRSQPLTRASLKALLDLSLNFVFGRGGRSRIVKKNDESLDDFRYGSDDFDANDNHSVCNKLNDPSRIAAAASFVRDFQLDGVLTRF